MISCAQGPHIIPRARDMSRLLLTGSEGRIGSTIGPHLAEQHDTRTADLLDGTWHTAEHIKGSLADPDLAAQACREIDTVLHLAHAPVEPDEDYVTDKDPNLRMIFALIRAAREAGCRRFICASSVHAVAGYPEGVLVTEDMAPRPDCRYGLLKATFEAACALEATKGDLSAFAVRIGSCHGPKQERVEHPLTYSAYLDWRDMLQLARLMIDAPDELRHGVFHGMSKVKKPLMSYDITTETLGYEPEYMFEGIPE